MEYLNDYTQPLKTINESDFKFFDFLELKNYIYGATSIDETGIKKFSSLDTVVAESDGAQFTEMLLSTNLHTSGVRLRFFSNSSTVVIKAQLKRKYAHQKMLLCCSSGFDIYSGNPQTGNLTHNTIVAPDEPNNIFAHKIFFGKNNFIEIYFPAYNQVEKLSIGIEKDCSITDAPPYKSSEPILFYGNSITQGASASRSGNSFANIVGRQMNYDILNFSFSGACKGERSMAQLIGETTKASAIVIDYSRNASNYQEFTERYEPFYLKLREYFKDTPIVLITAFNWSSLSQHIKTIHDKYKKDHKLYIVDVNKLFYDLQPTSTSIDNIHYTDIGMFRLADEICAVLSQVI